MEKKTDDTVASASNGLPSKSTRFALRPEQKALPLFQELISRFSQPGDIVVDFFSGSFPISLACVSLPSHHIFVGCEIEDSFFQLEKQHVIQTFAAITSDPQQITDIELPWAELPAATILRLSRESRRGGDAFWVTSAELSQFQRFPEHFHSYLASICSFPDRFVTQFSRATFNKWPLDLRRCLNTMNY